MISAATIIVTRNDDLGVAGDGGCDLRDAINSANINFALEDCTAGDAGTMDEIIIIVAGSIQLTSQIDIIGSTSISPHINVPRITIQAAPNSQIFIVSPFVDHDDDFHMERMRLINGAAGSGAAIEFPIDLDRYNSSQEITLTDIEFENNQGGAISSNHNWADIFRVTQSKFINNSIAASLVAPVDDLHNSTFEFKNNLIEGNDGGVLISANDNINNHFIVGNRFISNSGGLYLGASGSTGGTTFYLENNVFLDNHRDDGGALRASKSELLLVNNTFAFNSSDNGGAIYLFNEATLEMTNNTLVYNHATQSGANIRAQGANSVNIGNSIFAYSTGASNCSSTLVSINSSGGNIVDDSSCSFNNVNDVIGNPLLSGLVYHDSGLSGFIPTEDSPAIDNNPNPVCLDFWASVIEFDQQGNSRTTDGDGDGTAYCDAGAIEAPANTDLIWSDSLGG